MAILFAAIVIGVAMWLVLNRTRLGMLIRAGVDDREMLAASGVRIQYVFLAVFAFGAGLAGMARHRRRHVPVAVAGRGHAVPARLARRRDRRRHGVDPGRGDRGADHRDAEQLGLVYAPTYSVVFTFLIMAAVLAFRPQGLLGARR